MPPDLPIFVISLARAKARRENIRARLDKLDAQYEIVDAVDGATLTDADYGDNILRRDKFRRKFGREMLDGEIGCYLSHYRLWQRMVAEKIPSALVLEDDADWDEDILAVADDIDNLDWSWGVVLLSGRKHKKNRGHVLAPVGDNRKLLLCAKRRVTTAGYVISQMGAWALLQHCREISAPIDISYGEWWSSEIPFYAVLPPVVRQVESESLVKSRYTKAPLSDRIAASLWRKKQRWHCYMRYLLTSPSEERGDDEEEL